VEAETIGTHGNAVWRARETLHPAWPPTTRSVWGIRTGYAHDGGVQGVGQLYNVEGTTAQRGMSHTDTPDGDHGGKGAGPGRDGEVHQAPEAAPEYPAPCARPDTCSSAVAPCLCHRSTPWRITGEWGCGPGHRWQTWVTYGEHPEAHLRTSPADSNEGVLYTPKPDGRQRPIGKSTLEDQIIQRARVEMPSAIYEENFLWFSYGFRLVLQL
jgi:hypothetical protein